MHRLPSSQPRRETGSVPVPDHHPRPRRNRRPWLGPLALALAGWLGACAVPPAANYVPPGQVRVTMNGGAVMTAQAALQAKARTDAAQRAQLPIEPHPIQARVRIVVPDHNRMRPLVMQQLPRATPQVVAFATREESLDLHDLAKIIAHSRLFRSSEITVQNDTAAPPMDGADYLIWFEVRSLTLNDAGPWFGHWEMKSARSPRIVPLALDVGTPPGLPRLESFVKSARLAVQELNGPGPFAAAGVAAPQRSDGSGIVVDAQGHVLTNNHVVAGCPDLRVSSPNAPTRSAIVAAGDPADDLALLQTNRPAAHWARFRSSRSLQPGEQVIATGFPLTSMVSPDMAVTTGSLTTMTGAGGNARQFEFSAPIQPGNSGGPVMDGTGHVVGVATATLNGLLVGLITGGAVPQNVNFAIKSGTVRRFLAAHHVVVDDGGGRQDIGTVAVADLARRFTVRVQCQR